MKSPAPPPALPSLPGPLHNIDIGVITEANIFIIDMFSVNVCSRINLRRTLGRGKVEEEEEEEEGEEGEEGEEEEEEEESCEL